MSEERKPLSAWVNSPWSDAEYKLLKSCGISHAASLKEADVSLFVGGADLNPFLYDEAALPGTRYDDKRDKDDLEAWRASKGKFKIGICRGGQFLNVMNGGRLWQDVDNHTRHHDIVDSFTGEVIPQVSSTHHQQFRPAYEAIVIATARETTFKASAGQRWTLSNNGTPLDDYYKVDHEVLFYPRSRSLCFQPHPEYEGELTTAKYFREVLAKCLADEYPHKPKRK